MALPDTFTGSNGTTLTSYNALWVQNATQTGVMEIQSNKAVQNASPAATACYVYDQSPASADYDVSATIQTSSGSALFALVARADKTANTMYSFRWNAGNLQLYKFVAGTATQLGTDVTQGLSLNTDYVFKISVSGTTIKGYVDGVEKISQTDSAISATGYPGIRVNNTTTVKYDAFDCTNMSGAATATTLSGPSSGTVSVASSNFTVGANGTITGTVTVTPGDAGNGGTFTPTSVAISSGTPTATFTYTPASTGVKTISISDDGGLTDATSLSYTSNAAASGYAPALFTMRSPSGVHFFGAHR